MVLSRNNLQNKIFHYIGFTPFASEISDLSKNPHFSMKWGFYLLYFFWSARIDIYFIWEYCSRSSLFSFCLRIRIQVYQLSSLNYYFKLWKLLFLFFVLVWFLLLNLSMVWTILRMLLLLLSTLIRFNQKNQFLLQHLLIFFESCLVVLLLLWVFSIFFLWMRYWILRCK